MVCIGERYENRVEGSKEEAEWINSKDVESEEIKRKSELKLFPKTRGQSSAGFHLFHFGVQSGVLGLYICSPLSALKRQSTTLSLAGTDSTAVLCQLSCMRRDFPSPES